MKISTFTVVCGGRECNAKCPYCVSKMTKGVGACNCSVDDINIRNFRKACLFAKQSGVSTVLLTGVGEPLLYASHVQTYLQLLEKFEFPFIELQTNGIELEKFSIGALPLWYTMGLNTVSLSVVSQWDEDNRSIFGSKWKTLKENIKLLHSKGLSVRISCIMLDGYVDSVTRVLEMIDFCKRHKAEQLTCRAVGMPGDSKNRTISNWVMQHMLEPGTEREIADYFARNINSTLLLTLPHGANVYDYDGQNISINNCLTHSPNPDSVRQLIFAADGHLRFSWEHAGAIIF